MCLLAFDPIDDRRLADALSLLANTVMAWNTAQMQVIFDQWGRRRSGAGLAFEEPSQLTRFLEQDTNTW